MTGGYIGASGTWDGANQRKSVLRQRAIARLARENTRVCQDWRYAIAECLQAIYGTIIRDDKVRIDRKGRVARDRTHVGGPVGSWEDLRRDDRASGLVILKKKGFWRDLAPVLK